MGFSGFGFDSAQGGLAGFQGAQGGGGGVEPNPLLDDIQYHFKFDSISGFLTDSITGNVLSSTNSPTTEVGVVGQSIGINDTDESRAFSTNSAFLTAASESASADPSANVAYPFTVALWVYPELRSGWAYSTYWLIETNSSGWNWILWAEPSWDGSTHKFYFGVVGNGSLRYCNLSTVQGFDSWHFLVLNYYGINHDETGSFQLTENAKRISLVTGSAGSGSITDTGFHTCCGEELQAGTELKIGDAPSYDVNGRYDLFTRWNRIVPDDQILEFYNLSKAGVAPI